MKGKKTSIAAVVAARITKPRNEFEYRDGRCERMASCDSFRRNVPF
jgi:hypothetical protein